MKRYRLYVGVLSVLVVIILAVGHILYAPYSYQDSPVVVTIPQGASTRQIGSILKQNQLIYSISAFYFYSRILGYDTGLRAGEFTLNRNHSLSQTLQTLRYANGAQHLIRVTIPEGLRITEIADRLEEKEIVRKTAFLSFLSRQAKTRFQGQYSFLQNIPVDNLEGYLFPDTYFFSKNTPPDVVVNAFFKQFEAKIVPIWDQFKTTPFFGTSTITSLHRALTLSSIIEKEAAVKSERPLISSVFNNRLKKRMRLAACPTVIYAIGAEWTRHMTYDDVKLDSPYNTYKYAGLPPGPIAATGTASFAAALYPARTQYLFFVANRDGTHSFSKTYEDHLLVQRTIRRKNKR